MYFRSTTLALPLALLTLSTTALDITGPTGGSTVSLTSPLVVTWTSSSSDPSSFTLELVNTDPASSSGTVTLATDVSTSKGSYTVPQTTVNDLSYGAGFEVWAVSNTDSSSTQQPLAKSGSFDLADGVYSLSTASGGLLTIVTSSTSTAAAESTGNGGAASTTLTSSAATHTATSKGVPIQASSSSAASASGSSSGSPSTTSGSGQAGSPFDSSDAVVLKQSLLPIGVMLGAVLAVLA